MSGENVNFYNQSMEDNMTKYSNDPRARKAEVDRNSVYLKPNVFKMVARTLEIQEALYEKKFGKKFVSSIEKDQAKRKGKDQEINY